MTKMTHNDNVTGDVSILASYVNVSGVPSSNNVTYVIDSDDVTSGRLAASADGGRATTLLSDIAAAMPPPGGDTVTTTTTTPATAAAHVATTVIQNGPGSSAMISDMQLHFIVVGCLFLVVVILALINLYIHFRSGGRVLVGVKIVGTERVTRRGGYTVKMTAKPNVFL